MEYLVISLLGILIILAGWIILELCWRKSLNKTEDNQQSALMLQQQIDALRQHFQNSMENNTRLINQQIGQMTQTIQQASTTMSGQANSMSHMAGQVQSKLGQLEEANKRIFDIGRELSQLQEILQAPKLRGGLGEYFLEDIIKQILPPKYYTMSYTFKNGKRVDAVIHLSDKLVPVDSKFPLESFKRLLESNTDEYKKSIKKEFISAVKTHINAIATKYIQPSENTYNFALMYIPAENVYYEIIIKDDYMDEKNSLISYAMENRVIPVSPNSFYAYLQTILMGLKGFEIEKRTADIIQQLSQLQSDFKQFRSNFEINGTHLRNLQSAYQKTYIQFNKIANQIEQITGIKDIQIIENIKSEYIPENLNK